MAKAKVYYKHELSGLVASATESGYSVDNLLIFLEGEIWKGVGTGTHTITFDAGVGNTIAADYVGVINHNLSGATFKLQHSTTGAYAGEEVTVVNFSPTSNIPFLKEFTSADKRYWRIELSSLTAAPFMGIAYWGELVEWYYPNLFDPDSESDLANVNRSPSGYILGINETYVERTIRIAFDAVENNSTLWNAIKDWWNNHGLSLMFLSWDIVNHPNDIYVVSSDGKFKAPYVEATKRNVSLTFKGRVGE